MLIQDCNPNPRLGPLRLGDDEKLPENVFIVGRCPHDWLLPRVAAVIHHGGAGTVGAGLRLGLPTMCCPFFGDQHFYAHACAAIGAGPPPIDFERLSVPGLAASLTAITEPRFKEVATQLALKINSEDGLEAGLTHFHRSLPLANMVSDPIGHSMALLAFHLPHLLACAASDVQRLRFVATGV